jgi:branched-chain amino acid transport system permease protein
VEVYILFFLQGLAQGLLLFLLSAGFTLIFSLLGIFNFAHAGFYMLGAYFAYSLTTWSGFIVALLFVPILCALVGLCFEHTLLRRVYHKGHMAEFLVTFGFLLVLVELVQIFWGTAPLPYNIPLWLQTTALELAGIHFSLYRIFIITIALLISTFLFYLVYKTRIGLLMRAAVVNPTALHLLGHNLRGLYNTIFAMSCGLAGLAGVLGGNLLVTEPAMALQFGTLIFVIAIVGGLGSLIGAFFVSLLIGFLQSLTVLWGGDFARYAPLIPYMMMVIVLVLRPHGLWGQRFV